MTTTKPRVIQKFCLKKKEETTVEHAIIVAASVIASALAIGLAAFGAAMGDGQVTAKAIEGMARQPEAKGTILVNMFISVGLIESIPIIAAVIALVLVFANPFIK